MVPAALLLLKKLISSSKFTYYQGTTLNTYIIIATLFTVLFLAFCIPINLAILWEYRQKTKQHRSHVGPQPNQLQSQGTIGRKRTNVAANIEADRIERRLFTFAVITFFGHVLIAFHLVS
jgi:hypothetical protein